VWVWADNFDSEFGEVSVVYTYTLYTRGPSAIAEFLVVVVGKCYFSVVCVILVRLHDSVQDEGFHYLVFDL